MGTPESSPAPGAGVNPITFSDDGRLFVSQCFMDTRLFELDPQGVDEPRLIRDDLGPGCGLNGMDWGSADGRLYGPRWFRGEVARVDVDSWRTRDCSGRLRRPGGGEVRQLGSAPCLGLLARRGTSGWARTAPGEVVARVQPGLDNFAFNDEDRLFISSFADGFIVEAVSPNENRVVLAGGLNMPGGVALIGGESPRLVVADFFALRQLDPATGEELSVVRDVIWLFRPWNFDVGSRDGRRTARADELVRPTPFAFGDPDADALVQMFDGLAQPIDALLFEGEIVASQWGDGNVIAFSPESPEQKRVLVDGLSGPAGLTTAGRRHCTSPTIWPAPCTASATPAPNWWPKVSTSLKGSRPRTVPSTSSRQATAG